MKLNTALILIVATIALIGAVWSFRNTPGPVVSSLQRVPVSATTTRSAQVTSTSDLADPPMPALTLPLSDALSRVTKKPFGLYVTPKTSPVQPEKFTGYHTGADLETTPDEADVDVPVSAVCDGTLLVKRTATGYGGIAVQSCTIKGQAVTVVYGHLRLAGVTPNVGDHLAAGETFAVLGTGYSSETDGERKHLHLGIHKGKTVNILGYVQAKADLAQWIDPLSIMQ